MTWPLIRLPEPKILTEQLKEKRWVDFYLKSDYIHGSSESMEILNKVMHAYGKINIQLVETKSKTEGSSKE